MCRKKKQNHKKSQKKKQNRQTTTTTTTTQKNKKKETRQQQQGSVGTLTNTTRYSRHNSTLLPINTILTPHPSPTLPHPPPYKLSHKDKNAGPPKIDASYSCTNPGATLECTKNNYKPRPPSPPPAVGRTYACACLSVTLRNKKHKNACLSVPKPPKNAHPKPNNRPCLVSTVGVDKKKRIPRNCVVVVVEHGRPAHKN